MQLFQLGAPTNIVLCHECLSDNEWTTQTHELSHYFAKFKKEAAEAGLKVISELDPYAIMLLGYHCCRGLVTYRHGVFIFLCRQISPRA